MDERVLPITVHSPDLLDDLSCVQVLWQITLTGWCRCTFNQY